MNFLNSHRLFPALTLLLCWMAIAPVVLAQPVIQLASGDFHTVALLSNGTVMAWGWNNVGQLGLGNLTNQNTPQLINCIVGGPYALSLGHTADYINASMTCGGAAAANDWYFNVFSTDALNASNPGTGTWFGLHIDAAALYSHFDLALGGFPLVFGQLNSGGGQSTSIAFPTALLAGVTIYGVSITADPLTNAISGASAVTAHSF